MPNRISLRSITGFFSTPDPASLIVGELCINLDSGYLYVKLADGNVKTIGPINLGDLRDVVTASLPPPPEGDGALLVYRTGATTGAWIAQQKPNLDVGSLAAFGEQIYAAGNLIVNGKARIGSPVVPTYVISAANRPCFWPIRYSDDRVEVNEGSYGASNNMSPSSTSVSSADGIVNDGSPPISKKCGATFGFLSNSTSQYCFCGAGAGNRAYSILFRPRVSSAKKPLVSYRRTVGATTTQAFLIEVAADNQSITILWNDADPLGAANIKTMTLNAPSKEGAWNHIGVSICAGQPTLASLNGGPVAQSATPNVYGANYTGGAGTGHASFIGAAWSGTATYIGEVDIDFVEVFGGALPYKAQDLTALAGLRLPMPPAVYGSPDFPSSAFDNTVGGRTWLDNANVGKLAVLCDEREKTAIARLLPNAASPVARAVIAARLKSDPDDAPITQQFSASALPEDMQVELHEDDGEVRIGANFVALMASFACELEALRNATREALAVAARAKFDASITGAETSVRNLIQNARNSAANVKGNA